MCIDGLQNILNLNSWEFVKASHIFLDLSRLRRIHVWVAARKTVREAATLANLNLNWILMACASFFTVKRKLWKLNLGLVGFIVAWCSSKSPLLYSFLFQMSCWLLCGTYGLLISCYNVVHLDYLNFEPCQAINFWHIFHMYELYYHRDFDLLSSYSNGDNWWTVTSCWVASILGNLRDGDYFISDSIRSNFTFDKRKKCSDFPISCWIFLSKRHDKGCP